MLESLARPAGRDRPGKAGAAVAAPALTQAARYELALAYRALGQSALAEAILAEPGQGDDRTGRRRCPVPARPGSPGRRTIRRSRPPLEAIWRPTPRVTSPMSPWLIWPWRDWGWASSTTPGKPWPRLAERFPAQPGPRSDPAAAGRGRTGRPSGRAGRRAVPAGCRRRHIERAVATIARANEPTRPSRAADSGAGGPGKGALGAGQAGRGGRGVRRACSSWPPTTRSRRRSPWPRVAHSRPQADRCRSQSLFARSWNGLRNPTRPRRPAWPRPGSWPEPAAATKRRAAFERLIDDQHARDSLRVGRRDSRRPAGRVGMGASRRRKAGRSRPGLHPLAQGVSRQSATPPMPVSTWPSRPTWPTTMPRWSGC